MPRQSLSNRKPDRRTDWAQAQNGTSRISLSEPKASLRVSARCMTLAITLRLPAFAASYVSSTVLSSATVSSFQRRVTRTSLIHLLSRHRPCTLPVAINAAHAAILLHPIFVVSIAPIAFPCLCITIFSSLDFPLRTSCYHC